MKKEIIILFSFILISLVGLGLSIENVIKNELQRILPQLQEEYLSLQTVKLNGEVYVCGTIHNNRDKESLYCRGFEDGFSGAIRLLQIDNQIQSQIK